MVQIWYKKVILYLCIKYLHIKTFSTNGRYYNLQSNQYYNFFDLEQYFINNLFY